VYVRGVVLKRSGGTPETRLLNNFGLYTRCAEIVLHGVSVSNQLQQWTNFCARISVQKSGGVGDASLQSKKVGDAVPPPPRTRPTTPPVYVPSREAWWRNDRASDLRSRGRLFESRLAYDDSGQVVLTQLPRRHALRY